MEAEKAVLKNDPTVAKAKFCTSIEHANQQGFIHEESLAYERFAVAMLEWGNVAESLKFFERARYLHN